MSNGGVISALSPEEIADTIHRVTKFKVSDLKDLARSLDLRLAGKKQDLVDRIVHFFELGKQVNDQVRLVSIRTLVLKKATHDPLPKFPELYNSIRTGAYIYVDTTSSLKNPVPMGDSSVPYTGHSLYFKESPFYSIIRYVNGSPQIAYPTKGRNVCSYNFVLKDDERQFLESKNSRFKFYLACGVPNNHSPSSTDVTLQFPNPVELHVNGQLIKENVKGIKGRPGTAKPADVTLYIRGKNKLNKIQMVYTTTVDTYLLYLCIVQTKPSKELIQKVIEKPHIHKEATISRIRGHNKHKDDDDDDIVVSSSSVTLRDPLSYTRMRYPIQSIFCTHTECFDGLTFLESQLQIPTWSCPHCHRSITIDDLAVSDYFLEILESVPEDVDHVNINEDGSWEVDEQHRDKQENDSYGLNLDHETGLAPKKDSSIIPEGVEVVSIDSESEEEAPSPIVALDNIRPVHPQGAQADEFRGNVASAELGNHEDRSNHQRGPSRIWVPTGQVSEYDSLNVVPQSNQASAPILGQRHGSVPSLFPNRIMPVQFSIPLPTNGQQYQTVRGGKKVGTESQRDTNSGSETEEEVNVPRRRGPGRNFRTITESPSAPPLPEPTSLNGGLGNRNSNEVDSTNSALAGSLLPSFGSLSSNFNSSLSQSTSPSVEIPPPPLPQPSLRSNLTSSSISPAKYPEVMRESLANQESRRLQQRKQYEKHLEMKNLFQQSILRRSQTEQMLSNLQRAASQSEENVPHARNNEASSTTPLHNDDAGNGEYWAPSPEEVFPNDEQESNGTSHVQSGPSDQEGSTPLVSTSQMKVRDPRQMKYSRLAFDIVNDVRKLSESSTAPITKKQRVTEENANEQSQNALLSSPAQMSSIPSVSPLNGRIGDILLDTPRSRTGTQAIRELGDNDE